VTVLKKSKEKNVNLGKKGLDVFFQKSQPCNNHMYVLISNIHTFLRYIWSYIKLSANQSRLTSQKVKLSIAKARLKLLYLILFITLNKEFLSDNKSEFGSGEIFTRRSLTNGQEFMDEVRTSKLEKQHVVDTSS